MRTSARAPLQLTVGLSEVAEAGCARTTGGL